MKKAAFYTLGCKVNQYETEAMEELFKNAGYEISDFDGYADVYVINTCTVTSMSDRKSRQIIRRAKKHNPSATVAVTGCYAQTAPEAVMAIDDVDIIIGTKDRKRIVELCENKAQNTKINCVSDIMKHHAFEELSLYEHHDRTRAFIKIQEGCSQFCSYCIIPYARGPIRSRDEGDILDEIKRMVKKGYSEIVLTGIHVASFGLDKGSPRLGALINAADAVPGVRRIRLSSIEPMTLDQSFINGIKNAKKLCPHFHLSLQSGADETLKRMNRKYTTAEYKNIVDGIRKNFPDAAITTDIMVGFPGETEEEFQKTVEFVKEIRFSDAHIFQYSPRKGTPAAGFPDQIPPEIKEKRSKTLIGLCAALRDEFISSHIGKTVEVLFEQPAGGGYFEGKTDNYITVKVPSDGDMNGKFLNVFIESAKNGHAYGRVIK